MKSSRSHVLPAGSYRRQFKLIELLIVIAVIAILAGLLLPTMAHARDKAKSINCVSNIKQLGIALQSYASDNRDCLVLCASQDNTRLWSGTLEGSEYRPKGGLTDYLGNSNNVKRCPSTPIVTAGYNTGCGGYGYNVQYPGDPWGIGYTKINRARHASGTIAFADSADFDANGNMVETYQINGPQAPYVSPNIHFRHFGKTNVNWLDGHVTTEAIMFSGTHYALGSKEICLKACKLGWFGDEARGNYLFELE